MGDSVLADGYVDAAGSGDRVFYDLPHVAVEELDPGAGTAGVRSCFFSGICEQVWSATGGSGVCEPFLYLDDREYQLVLWVSGDGIVRGCVSAVADGAGDDPEKAAADGICDDRFCIPGDPGKQQRDGDIRGNHVRTIRNVREGQRADGSVLAGDDDVLRGMPVDLYIAKSECVFTGISDGRNDGSADVFDGNHTYDDTVRNHFMLDTQSSAEAELSGETVT